MTFQSLPGKNKNLTKEIHFYLAPPGTQSMNLLRVQFYTHWGRFNVIEMHAGDYDLSAASQPIKSNFTMQNEAGTIGYHTGRWTFHLILPFILHNGFHLKLPNIQYTTGV